MRPHSQAGWREKDSALVTRILIAVDHGIVRSGLKSIQEAHLNWEVVAEASDGKDAILEAIETKPEVDGNAHLRSPCSCDWNKDCDDKQMTG
jgi:hypothetical protein